MIFQLRHATEYAYAGRVELAGHVLHLRPRELPWQRVHRFALDVSEDAARLTQAADHFGNPVHRLFLDHDHGALSVVSEAVVQLLPRPAAPNPAATPAWENVAAMAQLADVARDVAEFAFATQMAPALPEAAEWAASSFRPGRPILACLLDLLACLARDFRFQPGVTTVSTSVRRVLQLRAGVCQDFAHLMIAALRALRLPARYVSGYVQTRPPPGMTRLRGADQSHAWVSCWLGPDWGWIDLDPTNELIVDQEHICLGWGRDYADVSPVHGVLLGGGAHTVAVSVDMEPARQGATCGLPENTSPPISWAK
jgi:transglutaminase-like putative cysteine protease